MLDQNIDKLIDGEPSPVGGVDSVTDAAIELLVRRRDLGVEKYGVELLTDNGRVAKADMVLELADAFLYSLQDYMESAGVPKWVPFSASNEYGTCIVADRQFLNIEKAAPSSDGLSWSETGSRQPVGFDVFWVMEVQSG